MPKSMIDNHLGWTARKNVIGIRAHENKNFIVGISNWSIILFIRGVTWQCQHPTNDWWKWIVSFLVMRKLSNMSLTGAALFCGIRQNYWLV